MESRLSAKNVKQAVNEHSDFKNTRHFGIPFRASGDCRNDEWACGCSIYE